MTGTGRACSICHLLLRVIGGVEASRAFRLVNAVMLTESQMCRYIVKEKKSFEIEILIKQKEF